MSNKALFNGKAAILILAAIFAGVQAKAQNMNKDVYVVRPYEPTLSDAAKYNFMPVISDADTSTPEFIYAISPQRLENKVEPEPIKAARTVTTSLPKIYNSWIKLGFGNYVTPLAEFNISNLRSKDYAYGAYIHHKSSHAKLRLMNDDKANAGYVENLINLYGKRFFPSTTLSGSLNFDQNAFYYYGYNTDRYILPPNLEKDSLRQRNYKPGIKLGIKSNSEDPEFIGFNINADVNYFIDRQKNKEMQALVNATFTKEVSGILGGLDLAAEYSNFDGKIDSTDNTIIRVAPWISKSSDDWQFKLGFEAVADIADINRFYFYPRANLDIIVVKDVLIPFFGATGELKKNSYQNLFKENMFIKPGLVLKNTSSNFTAYAGVKGNISSMVRFRADVSVTLFKDYHLFVNDTVTKIPFQLDNQFTAVYDDINLITYHGQLVFAPGNRFELMIDGKYYDYKTFEEARAWHKPDFMLSTEARYTVNKFELNAGLNFIGTRYAKDYTEVNNEKKLKPVLDLNLGIQYHYSRLLTVFADFHNLSENSYMLWNHYPSQRFNFIFGLTYKL